MNEKRKTIYSWTGFFQLLKFSSDDMQEFSEKKKMR